MRFLGLRKTLTGGVLTFAIATFLFPWGSSIADLLSKDTLPSETYNETLYFCGANVTEVSSAVPIEEVPGAVWFVVLVPFLFMMVGR